MFDHVFLKLLCLQDTLSYLLREVLSEKVPMDRPYSISDFALPSR
jgi:hypothetical protein